MASFDEDLDAASSPTIAKLRLFELCWWGWWRKESVKWAWLVKSWTLVISLIFILLAVPNPTDLQIANHGHPIVICHLAVLVDRQP